MEISISKDSKDERTVPLDDNDEESRLIFIAKPGLTWKTDDPVEGVPCCIEALKSIRVVPGFCTICLSGFYPDHEIVWSSNSECDHVFHRECMEQWLMKLPGIEEPICPCCRRDFVVDPYNLCFASRCE
jgi:hypothetical protein